MVKLPRRSRHNVNLWIVPLKMSMAAVGLFALTMVPDMLAANHVITLPTWLTMGGIDDARAILSAMLGCVSTVLALIFSVALLVLSMVANLFGPRLLYRFVQDWVTQVCIGLFMAAFIYVFLVFLVTHQDAHSSFIPQTSLITSWFVVLAAFGFLVFYSHRVALLIQNPDAIGRIVDDLRSVVKFSSRPARAETDAADLQRLEVHALDCAEVHAQKSGYLQWVEHENVVDAAASEGAMVVLLHRPGQFVIEGELLGTISPAAKSARLEFVVDHAVSFGRHRVLAQDVEFGIAQIVEIAIRALSPAINDTFTGVACVDMLGESLTLIEKAPAPNGRWYDSANVLRLQVRPLLLPRLIKQAFDQIRQAAADNPAVLLRMLSVIGRLAPAASTHDAHEALVVQANAVWETAQTKDPVSVDRDDLYRAWQAALGLLGERLESKYSPAP